MVANGSTPHASDQCKANCIAFLQDVRTSGTVLVDSGYQIFSEYLDNLSVVGQPGTGDAFIKWLWDNQGYEDILLRIDVPPAPAPQLFQDFPLDPRLTTFDASDRKFVAVAIASGLDPTVYNAVDSDWWKHGVALRECGVIVRNLCPELVV